MSRPRRVLILVVIGLAAALGTAAGSQAGPGQLRVGTLVLHHCPAHEPGWCGSLRRPLDPGLRGGPTIPIGFEWLPARSRRPPLGTIVAVEGGPGFPSTGSLDEYEGTFGPLMGDRNLLLVDNRGTGSSALIRCRSLDDFSITAPAIGPQFDQLVGACGRQLDQQYRGPHGRSIDAADLFNTGDSTQDLHAVVQALGVGRIDLYGDSYGSWFVQAFIARYPGVLRSVILDSTYAVRDLDPYYASSGSSGRAAADFVCERDPGCSAQAGPGTPVQRLAALLAQVRSKPISGTVTGVGVRPETITVDPRMLVELFQDAGFDPVIWHGFDAAVRAALTGDDVPILRLAADDNSNGGDADPGYFDDGAYMAISCTDYPQLLSMHATPAVRARQLQASIANAPTGAFAPFTAAEWVTMSGYDETYDSCLDWPAPQSHTPVLPAHSQPLPASVPMLVIGGDLDDLTPLSDVERFAPTLGRDVRVIDLPNTVHVTSEGDTYLDDGAACARSIIRRFVLAPASLQRLDAACAAQIPHVHTPGSYPLTLAAAAVPATVVSGPNPGSMALRAATVAAGAFADAVIQQASTGAGHGGGLRGGSFTVRGNRVTLTAVRYVDDAVVNGSGSYRASSGAVQATMTVTPGTGAHVTVTTTWNQRSLYATARIGTTELRLPAP